MSNRFSKGTLMALLLALTFGSTAALSSQNAFAEDKSAQPKPKYGPQTTRLANDHQYIRSHPAPDFWALMPYYVHQQDGRSCSVASVAMLVNAARAGQDLTASTQLITQKSLLETVKSEMWNKGVGVGGRGVTLDQLGGLIEQSLKSFGLNGAQVAIVHADTTKTTRDKLRQALERNEKSANDFMIINFLQSEYTGDPEGAVGHIAPVAAYDSIKKRVLVFDPDREWYEPYWVGEEALLKGMATRDGASARTRGYVYITLK